MKFPLAGLVLLVACNEQAHVSKSLKPLSGVEAQLRHPAIPRPKEDRPPAVVDGSGCTFVMAPTGSDTNPGTVDAPFATFDKARDALRAKNGNQTSGGVLCLRGGVYLVEKVWRFGAADSGSPAGPTVLKAYQDEKPILSAGKRVKGWRKSSLGPNIYEVGVGTHRFRSLYLAGEALTRARFPRSGVLPDLKRKGDMQKVAVEASMAQWLAESDAALVGQAEIVMPKTWNQTRIRLRSFQRESDNTVTINLSEVGGYTEYCTTSGGASNQCNLHDSNGNRYDAFGEYYGYWPQEFYFENHPAFLKAPGDWVLDETRDVLLLVAPKDVSSAADLEELEIWAPNGNTVNFPAPNHLSPYETILSLEGDLLRPIHDVQVSGLEFRYTNWLFPNWGGYLSYSGDTFMYITYKESNSPPTLNLESFPAAVNLHNSSDIKITNNRFIALSGSGVRVGSAAVDSVETGIEISNNSFENLAGGGVVVYHGKDVSVRKNQLRNIGYGYLSNGIYSIFSAEMKIMDNVITKVSSDGIAFHGWDSDFSKQGLIKGNTVSESSQWSRDGGAIYVNTIHRDANLTISENVISGIERPVWLDSSRWLNIYPVYLDFNSFGVSVLNNLINTPGFPLFVNCPASPVIQGNRAQEVKVNGTCEPGAIQIK